MTDKKDLTPNLAAAIEDVSPADILGYKNYYAKGFTVILKDFRKFTGVIPVDDADLPSTPAILDDDQYPPNMPDELKPVYDNPYGFRVSEIRKVAHVLEIRDASAFRKPALIEEIESWKKENTHTDEEE